MDDNETNQAEGLLSSLSMQKVLVFIALIVAAAWLINSNVYAPKAKEIKKLKITLAEIEREFKTILGEDVILKDGDPAQIKALETELQKLSEKIPTEKEVPFLISRFISEIGAGLNVDYDLIEPQPIVNETDYLRVPLKVEFLSNLQDFYSYLSQLKDLPSTIRIDSLSLSLNDQDQIKIAMEFSAFVIPGKPMQNLENAGAEPSYYKDIFEAKKKSVTFPTNRGTVEAISTRPEPALALKGIWGSQNPKAIINDSIAVVGDTVLGYTVTAVYHNRAVLTKNRKSITLYLEK